MTVELLLVSLDAVTFAVVAADVIEVARVVAITRVPGCPESIEGVINVRGRACPVYDLRGRFGLPAHPVERTEHLVVVDLGARGHAVVRVSRVHELRKLDPEIIARATPSVDPMIAGLVQLPDGLLVICDLKGFLTEVDATRTAHAIEAVEAAP